MKKPKTYAEMCEALGVSLEQMLRFNQNRKHKQDDKPRDSGLTTWGRCRRTKKPRPSGAKDGCSKGKTGSGR